MPSGIGPSDGVMGCGGARLGPGPGSGSGFTKGPMQGSYAGHGRGQASKHSSASSSSRLGNKHQHHKQASYAHSPQNSFTSGSHSGNSSGPPSRRFPAGESSGHSSPAGVLQFQQRQHQQHSPHHSPDHQHLSGSPLHRSGKAADVGKAPSDGLLPSPQMDMRNFYSADANNAHLMGGGSGYMGAVSNPNGRGLPMVAGLGQQQFLGVGVPTWPAQRTMFPPGQIYATDLFAGEYQVWRFKGILQVLV